MRILANSTGAMCYANAAVIGCAWQSATAHCMEQTRWQTGWQLFHLLTRCLPSPVNLFGCHEFQQLMQGKWSEEDFTVQHDSNEFALCWINLIQPGILRQTTWTIQPLGKELEDDPRFAHENGSACIDLNPVSIPGSSCSVQELINSWRDRQGLRRALQTSGRGLVLFINRHGELHNMGMSRMHIIDGYSPFMIPLVQAGSSTIQMKKYWPYAVVFHCGDQADAGHYRCSVLSKHGWMYYEDAQLPDIPTTQLPPKSHKLVQIWANDFPPEEIFTT